MNYKEKIKKYLPKMENYAKTLVHNEEDRKDLIQESLLRVWKFKDSYIEQGYFGTWLTTILYNTLCTKHRKKEIKVVDYPITTLEYDKGLWVNPNLKVDSDKMVSFIYKEVEKLPKKYRTVVKLNLQGIYSYKEIEEILNIPIGTVKSRIFRGNELLQDRLKFILEE